MKQRQVKKAQKKTAQRAAGKVSISPDVAPRIQKQGETFYVLVFEGKSKRYDGFPKMSDAIEHAQSHPVKKDVKITLKRAPIKNRGKKRKEKEKQKKTVPPKKQKVGKGGILKLFKQGQKKYGKK